MRELVVNSGSSSLKLSVLDGDRMRRAEELPASRGWVDEALVASLAGMASMSAAMDGLDALVFTGG